MKSEISKGSIVIRFGLLGWLLYQKNKDKFMDNKRYIFKLYTTAFFLFYFVLLSLVLFFSVSVWFYSELLVIPFSCLYGWWASKFFFEHY